MVVAVCQAGQFAGTDEELQILSEFIASLKEE